MTMPREFQELLLKPTVRRKYSASRGGHAPGHLREAFLDYILSDSQNATVVIDEQERPLKWLLGQFWNCSDILPGDVCDEIDLPRGSSYSIAARRLAQDYRG